MTLLTGCEPNQLYFASHTVVGVNAAVNPEQTSGWLIIGYDRTFATVIPRSVTPAAGGQPRDAMSVLACSSLSVKGITIKRYTELIATGEAAKTFAAKLRAVDTKGGDDRCLERREGLFRLLQGQAYTGRPPHERQPPPPPSNDDPAVGGRHCRLGRRLRTDPGVRRARRHQFRNPRERLLLTADRSEFRPRPDRSRPLSRRPAKAAVSRTARPSTCSPASRSSHDYDPAKPVARRCEDRHPVRVRRGGRKSSLTSPPVVAASSM